MIGWIGAGLAAVVTVGWVGMQRALWGGHRCDRHDQRDACDRRTV